MDVIRFETNLESNLIEIQNSLLWKTYQTGPYRNFKVFEPKERDIAITPDDANDLPFATSGV